MKNILIPTDFSDNGADAFAYAMNFVGDEEAKFHVLNVVVPVAHTIEFPSTAAAASRALMEDAQNNLESIEAFKGKDDMVKEKVEISTKVILGDVAPSIIKEAKRIHADAIIMGTTGKGALNNMKRFVGSSSAEVASKAKTPVILVPKGYFFNELERITYATNLDKNDPFNIWKVAKLLRPNTVVVDCLHIADEGEIMDDEVREFEDFLKDSSTSINTSFHVVTKDDNIEDTIADFADDTDSDMIVMARSERGFWNRIFGTRHTKKMVFELEVPLLVV